MKRRSDKPNQWRPRIDFHAFEIAVALKIPFSLMAANAQSVIHSLQRQLNIFRRFEFNHDQPCLACDSQ
jgi:hypothetical protein